MLKRRTAPWITFVIAMLLPLMSVGCVFVGNMSIVGGYLTPVSAPASGQPQEEELPSHGKAAVGKVIKRKRDRFPLDQRPAAFTVIYREFQQDSPQSWVPADSLPRPSTLYLDNNLSRRGPPVA